MYEYKLTVTTPRPYFAEFPYALWGEVNYDSDGDCQRPTDREWTQLAIEHRMTHDRISITGAGQDFSVKSLNRSLAARAAMFLAERSNATIVGDHPQPHIGIWSYTNAYSMTARIRAEFPRPELIPFDSKLFWGSWKWVGWFATDLTWVGRWIMNSLLTHDTRAVELCIFWLRGGTAHPDQGIALRHALHLLTGQQFASDQEWIAWYDNTGYQQYPKPDFDEWLNDLKGH